MDCLGTYFTHVQTCDVTRVQCATEWTASVHTLHMWCNSCSKCYGMDCLGTYFTHVQTCDVTRVQSATEWTAWVHALHMSKPVMLLVFNVLRNGLLRYMLYTCPNLWCNSCAKCYGMDCLGTCFTHVQTCDVTRVQSATEWTASVHTLHMSKPVMSLVFKVLRNGLLRYMLYTCPNLWCNSFNVLRNGLLRYMLDTCPDLWCNSCSKCYGMNCLGTCFTHVQTCDVTRVQSATEWTASVHALHMSKRVM